MTSSSIQGIELMSPARPILIIFGDGEVRETVADHLNATDKFEITEASTLYEATNILKVTSFDAIILDVQLPDGGGIEFCSTLRSLGNKIPIILLRDGSADADVIRGLQAGASDYITNIARSKELIARLAAQLRVFDNSTDATLAVGLFTFRPAEKLLLGPQPNRRTRLTTKESELLKFLCQARGACVTRKLLLSEVWGYKIGVVSNTVDTHINRLRRKMLNDATNGVFITMPGGYRLHTLSEGYGNSQRR